MTPAQQALKAKLAKLKAAGGSSNGTSTTQEATKQSTPTESIQEREAQEVPSTQAEFGSVTVQQEISSPIQVEVKQETSTIDHPIKMQLAELEQALNEKLPGFKTILRDIHTKLRQDPAIVTLLTDEEIGGIIAGLKHHAQVDVIAPKAAKTAKKETKAKIANMSADDL